ncbi:MAG TPA: S8 family serine peptidase, partial [Bryobacteraceae bacterium]|jgi:subtilisin family serine protease
MSGMLDENGLAGLMNEKNHVEEVLAAPQFRVLTGREDNRSLSTEQATWGVERLQIDDLNYTGKGIKIGHIDTGVDPAHPVLNGDTAAVQGFAYINEDGTVDRTVPPMDFSAQGHGTHTAGTIAGRYVEGVPRIGVAPGCSLFSAVVGSDDSELHLLDRLIGALNWVISQGVQVVNMSVGCDGEPDALQGLIQLFQSMLTRNILPVCAAGDRGSGNGDAPGNYTNVISVGASDASDGVWSESGSADVPRIVPDLLAPGVSVYSSLPTNLSPQYGTKTGTSMAAPHISGLAALMMEAKPDRTAAEIKGAIFGGCRRPGTVPAPRGNRGIPTLPQALANLS